MPNSVGPRPVYHFSTPSCCATFLKPSTMPLYLTGGCRERRERIKSSGYVHVVAVMPAQTPAANLPAIVISLPGSKEAKTALNEGKTESWMAEKGKMRHIFAPLPRKYPLTPSLRYIWTRVRQTPCSLIFGSPHMYMIFILSSGDTHVLDTAPAMPPARNFIKIGSSDDDDDDDEGGDEVDKVGEVGTGGADDRICVCADSGDIRDNEVGAGDCMNVDRVLLLSISEMNMSSPRSTEAMAK